MMNKDNSIIPPNVNQIIIDKLRSYPEEIAKLAIEAIRLSEKLPGASVFDTLQSLVRKAARNYGGDS